MAGARDKLSAATGLGAAAERGQRAAFMAGARVSGSGAGAPGGAGPADEAPQWARRLRSEQSARHHRHAALQAVREGDRGGAAATPDIKERED